MNKTLLLCNKTSRGGNTTGANFINGDLTEGSYEVILYPNLGIGFAQMETQYVEYFTESMGKASMCVFPLSETAE